MACTFPNLQQALNDYNWGYVIFIKCFRSDKKTVLNLTVLKALLHWIKYVASVGIHKL